MNAEQPELASADRDLVFVSHANPEDNGPALWLASKLSLAGYRVWSDVTQLFGGEVTWDDIEDAIRNHTAKFIILVSRNSQNANGVLDEVNLAVAVERGLGLSRFVIPSRLDDLPFDEFRANIARKNAIDFSQNWAFGLDQLLERLERDHVPKDINHSPNLISTWFSERYSAPAKIRNKPQLLGSNWIPITDIPQDIDFSRIPVAPSKANEMAKTFSFPTFAHQQFVGSFASSSDLQPDLSSWLVLTHGHKVSTQDLLQGTSPNFPNLTFQDGQNMVAGLLRKAWDNEMQKRGLLSYRFSDYTNAWFYPHGFAPNDTVAYTDLDGTARTKKLVGRSERLDAFWHFAVSANPRFGRLTRLSLKTHVVFSADGSTPLTSKEHMHAMRRSFCRNWFNERWRGLVIAYLNYLSGNRQTISLPVSPTRQVVVSAIPYSFKSNVSLEESAIPYEETPDEEFDRGVSDEDDLDEPDDSGLELQADEPHDPESEKGDAN